MMRAVGAIIAGLIAGFVVMFLVAMIGGAVFPTPIRVDTSDPGQIIEAFAAVPLGAKMFVLFSWFAGAFTGGAVAKFISGERWCAWVVAGLFTLYVLSNVFILPMETWMQIVAVVAPVLGGWLAGHVRGRARPVEQEGPADADISEL